ncbi:metallophosphoesterase [Treponema pedis]|uniref:Phosphoesterase n=1 Tax=Treponema pedis TaxID=409322 RepID=A0A7S7AXN3_9SPIR|nr:metallophosphoesterase [Treponema pedis]QOW61776.1 metallophosphoesterase [Treponema pedis]QSI04669.1 metallophosphoesterase [Treponema pedis]
MNSLEFLNNGIFGDNAALKKLDSSDKAVLLLLSDTHGDYSSVVNILKTYGKKADALLFSGDGLQDFLHIINNAIYDTSLRECLPSAICLVSGNSDSLRGILNLEAAREISSFQKNPEKILLFKEELFLTACGTKILLTHGHEFFVDYEFNTIGSFAKQNNCSIAIYGHTHFPLVEKINGIFLINPGSVSRPRGGSKRSFALLTLKKNKTPEIKFINYEDTY